MKNISKEQRGKRIVLLALGFIAIAGTFSIWITEASSKDQARFRKASATVHEEARDIVAKGATWTVASIDTAFSSKDHYVVKFRLTDGDTTVKVNCYPGQRVGRWHLLAVGSTVYLKMKNMVVSVKLSDHITPEFTSDKQTL